MEKVGIITCNGNTNFGNRLQNYALQKTIEKLGYEVDTIWFCHPKGYIKEKIKKPVFFITNKRKYKFMKFSKKYIHTKYYFNKNIKDKYDKFVAGSDQIWNYNFPDFNENMLLLFSNKKQNISYAASFGVDEIVPEKKQLFKKGLANFSYLSVREEKGKKIVDELLKTDDTIVSIDPTMLLKEEEWEEVMSKPKKIGEKKYILNYFLGTLSEKRKKEIGKFASENNCEIINMLDKNSSFYESGPSEFLYLEKNAFLICTDSFHASVFAMLFNRPFVIFDREDKEKNMNSRIETLLTKFKIENRKYNNKEITKENANYDYTMAYRILEEERKKSISYLKKALGEKGDK